MNDASCASETAIGNLSMALAPEGRQLVLVAAEDIEAALQTIENLRYELAVRSGMTAHHQERRLAPYRPAALVQALHEGFVRRAD